MYTEINGKKSSLLKFVKTNLGKEVVLHYTCQNCSDEQVTDEVEIDKDVINNIQNDDSFLFRLPCTNCGYHQPFIPFKEIKGIELM